MNTNFFPKQMNITYKYHIYQSTLLSLFNMKIRHFKNFKYKL